MARKKILALGKDGILLLRGPDGREVPAIAAEQAQGTSFLLVDCSGSMEGGKIDQARRGANEYMRKAIERGYEVGLISFDSKAELLVRRTSSSLDFQEPLSRLIAGGGTNMTAALNLAFSAVSSLRGARFVVVVSDGAPDDPVSALAAARSLASMGVQVITIATDGADLNFLASIATAPDSAIVVPRDQLGTGMAAAALSLPLIRDW